MSRLFEYFQDFWHQGKSLSLLVLFLWKFSRIFADLFEKLCLKVIFCCPFLQRYGQILEKKWHIDFFLFWCSLHLLLLFLRIWLIALVIHLSFNILFWFWNILIFLYKRIFRCIMFHLLVSLSLWICWLFGLLGISGTFIFIDKHSSVSCNFLWP